MISILWDFFAIVGIVVTALAGILYAWTWIIAKDQARENLSANPNIKYYLRHG